VEPLEVRATAELLEGQIRITGDLHTRLEMTCARVLSLVNEDVARDFDLFYRPLASMTKEEEERLKLDDTEIAFLRVKDFSWLTYWPNRCSWRCR